MREISIQYCSNKCTREHWQLLLECKREQLLNHDLLTIVIFSGRYAEVVLYSWGLAGIHLLAVWVKMNFINMTKSSSKVLQISFCNMSCGYPSLNMKTVTCLCKIGLHILFRPRSHLWSCNYSLIITRLSSRKYRNIIIHLT